MLRNASSALLISLNISPVTMLQDQCLLITPHDPFLSSVGREGSDPGGGSLVIYAPSPTAREARDTHITGGINYFEVLNGRLC